MKKPAKAMHRRLGWPKGFFSSSPLLLSSSEDSSESSIRSRDAARAASGLKLSPACTMRVVSCLQAVLLLQLPPPRHS